jgi:hypothetical protein
MSVFEAESFTNVYAADFPAGLTHAILVSTVNEEKMKKDYTVFKAFKNALIDRLSRDLPSIALSAYSVGGKMEYPLYADFVGRKLPLVLIDTRTPLPVVQHNVRDSQIVPNSIENFCDIVRTHLLRKANLEFL